MSIYEYDEEKHMKSIREEGRKEGREQGREEEAKKLLQLVRLLIESGKNEELERVLEDSEYRKKLYREYGIE